MTESEALYLRLEVRILSARKFIFVYLSCRSCEVRLELVVYRSYVSPVIREYLQVVEVEACVSAGVFACCDDGVQRRLAGEAGHAGDSSVRDIQVSDSSKCYCSDAVSGCVVSMQMYRYSKLVLQSCDELSCGYRSQQSGHVLDAEDVSASLLELLSHLDIVVKSVLRLCRVEDVACVADACFSDLALVEDFVESDFHALDPVQRVEDPEYVDAALGRLLDESSDNVVRIVLVSYAVSSSEKHLEQDVRDLGSERFESLPRILAEEPDRCVERSPAPHLE